MRNNRKFFVGLAGVATVITYLIWTGVNETMVYYFTPIELMARVKEDPSFHQVGIKVSGRIQQGFLGARGRSIHASLHGRRSGRRVGRLSRRVP